MASDYIKIASGCSTNSVLYRFEELEKYMAVQPVQLRLCGSISKKINCGKFAKSGRIHEFERARALPRQLLSLRTNNICELGSGLDPSIRVQIA